jgi:phosphoribulokinase
VDTSNPFEATDVPSNVDSLVVVHINNRKKMNVDFRYLLEMLNGSFMTRPDTIVIPAGKMEFAMEIIVTPVLEGIMKKCQMVRAEHP